MPKLGFGVLWSVFVFLPEDLPDRDLMLKTDFEQSQTSMPKVGFQPTDCGAEKQYQTIRPLPGFLRGL